MEKFDVIIIGAGAAGLMCAIEAGKRHRKVLVLDHANKVGKKILMSGGGRCNFTNYHVSPYHYLSHNPHFCKSALTRYTPQDFIRLVRSHHIPFHEKTLGQLFCDNKSSDIVNMLLQEAQKAEVKILLNTKVDKIEQRAATFYIKSTHGELTCQSLIIATGGLSIPTLGASPFGYKIAEQFNLKIWPTRAGLVPLTLHEEDKEKLSPLSGIAMETTVSHEEICFQENTLITHRGLSGPAILQISSYWQPGNSIEINLLPHKNIHTLISSEKQKYPDKKLKNFLVEFLPKRLIDTLLPCELSEQKLKILTEKEIHWLVTLIHAWKIKPNATEGYRTAEVTLGGVDCNALSSKTFEVTTTPGLYFIGEVLDVSGWLGGYNFQWAWSSGWAAGQVV